MSKVGIVTDSCSGLLPEEAKELGVFVLPMPFYIEGNCFYEGINLTRELFFEKLAATSEISTSQPPMTDLMELWDKVLEEYDELIHMPLSSGLSGSYGTAVALSKEEKYEGKVFVADTGRVSTPLVSYIKDAQRLIEKGYGAEKIRDILDTNKDKMVIYLGVETLEYLQRGGRISKSTAVLGNLLNIKPILKFDVGVLELFKKCRGLGKARKLMIEAIKQDLETVFAEEYKKGNVNLLAATSANEKETKKWLEEIKEAFPDMNVLSGNLSCAICCHTGPECLGIGISCTPDEK